MNRITFTHSFKQVKYKRIGIIVSVFLAVLLIVFGCKKIEQPDMATVTDPCDCAKEVSADFTIEERITNIPVEKWIETDSILNEKNVKFNAKIENADEYKWYIGSEIVSTKSVVRYFDSQWIGSNIPITLVVRKKPNKACFPNDDGYDSIKKVFYVSPYFILPSQMDEDRTAFHGGIAGTYKMFADGLLDSIEIKVSFISIAGSIQIDFENIDGLGTICNYDPEWWNRYVTSRSYREIHFSPSNNASDIFCNSLSGYIRRPLSGPDVIEVKSRLIDPQTGNINEKIFLYKGRKL